MSENSRGGVTGREKGLLIWNFINIEYDIIQCKWYKPLWMIKFSEHEKLWCYYSKAIAVKSEIMDNRG